MSISDVVERRGIKEVLHFTTNLGLIGILDSRHLKSRQRLNKDERLEHIFSPNAAVRDKDSAWLDYVNLSISRVNNKFFDISRNRWHKGKPLWWCVLSFRPIILSHNGVYFTTTNNIYTDVARGSGAEALESMFAPKIKQWAGTYVTRPTGMDTAWPTCEQAEVLYPGEVSTSFLQAIYVGGDEQVDEVYGLFAGLGHPEIGTIVQPRLFPNQ
jgi:ssDNA thymidine ADP-ribosyltransferase, DarT